MVIHSQNLFNYTNTTLSFYRCTSSFSRVGSVQKQISSTTFRVVENALAVQHYLRKKNLYKMKHL